MRIKLIVAVAGLVAIAVTAGVLSSRGRAGATPPPPPGWSLQAWAMLPAAKQAKLSQVESKLTGLGHDPSAKAPWLAAHPKPLLPPDDPNSGQPEQGIIQTTESSLPRDTYLLVNRWQALVGTTLVQVFAGSLRSSPNQGVVVKRVLNWPGTGVISTKAITAPAATGALKITAAAGSQLSLQSADGTRYSFDATKATLTRP